MKLIAALLLSLTLLGSSPSHAVVPESKTFAASYQDNRDIRVLLANYTRAVSTKDQLLFEGLLLNKEIPFSYVDTDSAKIAGSGTTNYEAFRKGVFEGEPFTQVFKDIRIEQDGNLANVRLVFINKTAGSTSWGWKTLQLLKVNGTWKIASEFYTGH